MEKLILKCGRYLPSAEGDTADRVRAMEVYLSHLSDELEYLLAELDRVLRETATVGEEG